MKLQYSLFIFLIFSVTSYAQKYQTKSGEIHFDASIPLFEDVDAKTNEAVVVFDTDSGGFATIAFAKSFVFKIKLMREHFNENYAESVTYPKTTFSGVVENFDKTKLSSNPKNYMITGSFTFHGVSNKVSSPATIYKKGNQVYVSGKFQVKTVDYEVKIPKMVSKKVAETVNVDYQFLLNENQ